MNAYKYFEDKVPKGWNDYEIAKDVAALANASGGTLLIGAVEDKHSGRLKGYESVDAAETKGLRDAVAEAVKNRCSPQPMVDVRSIRHSEHDLVAINVWPFFGQVVGVSVTAKPDHPGGYGGAAYVYPLRQIDRTIYLTAEQVPMFMIPEIRRVAALLTAIEVNEPGTWPGQRKARLRWRPQRTMPGPLVPSADCRIRSIDAMRNAVEGIVPSFTAKATKGRSASPGMDVEFSIPFEDVRSVWREGSVWWVLLAGYFDPNAECRYVPEVERMDG